MLSCWRPWLRRPGDAAVSQMAGSWQYSGVAQRTPCLQGLQVWLPGGNAYCFITSKVHSSYILFEILSRAHKAWYLGFWWWPLSGECTELGMRTGLVPNDPPPCARGGQTCSLVSFPIPQVRITAHGDHCYWGVDGTGLWVIATKWSPMNPTSMSSHPGWLLCTLNLSWPWDNRMQLEGPCANSKPRL